MDKGSRPVRNRKHSRSWTPNHSDPNHRPVKRLFTPEIKRMLKDWLVRRRENPYPSRDEKKSLAIKTGLTYIQICNWFANWRRKLKNAGKEPQKNTWGHLIKNYNSNARGNVEQFSICSNDSIWEDEERRLEYFERKRNQEGNDAYSHPIFYDGYSKYVDASYETVKYGGSNRDAFDTFGRDEKIHMADGAENESNNRHGLMARISTEQCYQVSSTTNNNNNTVTVMNGANQSSDQKPPFNYFSNAKYKNQIMEKYLRGLDDMDETQPNQTKCGLELSKWLESAANFTPEKNNYIEWESRRIRSKHDDFQEQYLSDANAINLHQKEELDAAEALTFLAGNCKSRWVK